MRTNEERWMRREYILAHTGPRGLDVHPQGGCGSGFGLVPGYTTLSVRVQANIKFGALKIKSVRTNERTKERHPRWSEVDRFLNRILTLLYSSGSCQKTLNRNPDEFRLVWEW